MCDVEGCFGRRLRVLHGARNHARHVYSVKRASDLRFTSTASQYAVYGIGTCHQRPSPTQQPI
eukprot:9106694-Pyramimonas_sp.AAC.1